jgi:prepilin-type N-terminal cleavage/methylation domain-containing protein
MTNEETPSSFVIRHSSFPRGFTLVEMMVVVLVIGILVAWAVPSFTRAMEQSQANIAAANLRAIWTAERWYWLESPNDPSNPNRPANTYTNSLTTLQGLGLIDQEIVQPPSAANYTYTVVLTDSGYIATAARNPGTAWSGGFTIDQNGQFPPQYQQCISAPQQVSITPGFQ